MQKYYGSQTSGANKIVRGSMDIRYAGETTGLAYDNNNFYIEFLYTTISVADLIMRRPKFVAMACENDGNRDI